MADPDQGRHPAPGTTLPQAKAELHRCEQWHAAELANLERVQREAALASRALSKAGSAFAAAETFDGIQKARERLTKAQERHRAAQDALTDAHRATDNAAAAMERAREVVAHIEGRIAAFQAEWRGMVRKIEHLEQRLRTMTGAEAARSIEVLQAHQRGLESIAAMLEHHGGAAPEH